jgi:hypothetical protein
VPIAAGAFGVETIDRVILSGERADEVSGYNIRARLGDASMRVFPMNIALRKESGAAS